MEVALSPSPTATVAFNTTPKISVSLSKKPLQASYPFPITVKLKALKKYGNHHSPAFSSAFCTDNLWVRTSSNSTRIISATSPSTPVAFTVPSSTTSYSNRHWVVVMENPPQGLNSKSQIIDYYVKTLQSVMGSEEDAQMCIYDASWETNFSFCCDIDGEISRELARLPGVLSVRPDPDFNSVEDDHNNSKVRFSPLNALSGSTLLFPAGNSKPWLVKMSKPEIEVVSKAQMVDYYTEVLTKVMGNEKDAQMCIYHVSWQADFGFCCKLDEECAQELVGVPGVLSVQPDENFESFNKDYEGKTSQQFGDYPDSEASSETKNIKTKKLFVAGLSFYTSEKTLRAAFEGFGDLVEVKIIMDKISKRSKGYAFVEYTTEEAASVALKEMNGKIINGWLISVDVARNNPPKYSRGRPRPSV